MIPERFLKDYVKGRKVTQCTITLFNKEYGDYHVPNYRGLKGLLEYIDFDCQINPKTGGCKEYVSVAKCCCNNCLDNVGFFRIMLPKDLKYYSRKFSVRTGFWRKGKGCNLPYHMRSVTCVTHNCTYEKPYFREGVEQIKLRLRQLREEMVQYHEKIVRKKLGVSTLTIKEN